MSKEYLRRFRFHFDQEKAAEAAAHLVRLKGGAMKYFDLIKMLYCAERESIRTLGRPICGDRYFAMDNGPVMGTILNLAKEVRTQNREPWDRWIKRVGKYKVGLRDPNVEPQYNKLSPAEMRILSEQYAKLKDLDWGGLRDYTHLFPEYVQPPEGSTIPIEAEDVLDALELPDDGRERVREVSDESFYLDKLFHTFRPG